MKHLTLRFALPLFGATLLLKLALILLYMYLRGWSLDTQLARIPDGDTLSYTLPAENLLYVGTYFYPVVPDADHPDGKMYAGRMPILGLHFIAFTSFLKSSLYSYWALAAYQLLLECLSVVLLAWLCYRYYPRRAAFWLCWGLLVFSYVHTFYSIKILTESLAFSYFILALFLTQRYFDTARIHPYLLLLAGVFFMLSSLLRLIFMPSLIVWLGYLVWKNVDLVLDGKFRQALVAIMLAAGPFFFFEVFWMTRNFNYYHKPVPFQINDIAGYDFGKGRMAMRNFLFKIGDSNANWDGHSLGCYFEPHPSVACEAEFPKDVIFPPYTMNDVEQLRGIYIHYQAETNSTIKDSLEMIVVQRFDSLSTAFDNHAGILRKVSVVFERASRLLLHSGVYHLGLRSKEQPDNQFYLCFKYFIKSINVLLYYGLLVSVFFIAPWLAYQGRIYFILFSVPFVSLFVLVLILRMTEWKQFFFMINMNIPALAVAMCCFLDLGKNKSRKTHV